MHSGTDKRRFSSWQWLISCVGLLAITIFAGWFVTGYLGDKAHREILRETESTTTLLMTHLTGEFNKTEAVVKSMSGSPWIAPALITPKDEDIERANSTLDRFNSAFNFSVSYLVDRTGITIASSNRNEPDSFVGNSYQFRPYFTEAMKGNLGHYFALGLTSLRRGYYVSSPVTDSNNTILGVVVVKIDFDRLEAQLSLEPYCFFVSPQGVIFLSSNADMLLKSLWPLRPEMANELAASKQFGNGPFDTVMPEKVMDGMTLILQGERYLASRKAIGPEGWSIILLASQNRVLIYKSIGVILTVVVCLFILVPFALAHQTIRSAETLYKSEERHRTILHTAMDGFLLFDRESRLMQVNDACCRMSGYSEQELLTMRVSDLEAAETTAETSVRIMKIMAEGEDRFESRHRCKDGRILDVEVSVKYQAIEGGQFVCFFRDITERKQAEHALRESEERYRQIARCVPDLVWTMDLSGRFTYVNSAVERNYDYTVEEFLKLSFHDTCTPEAAAKHAASLEERLTKAATPRYDPNTVATFLSEELRKDGSAFWAEVSAALLWSDDGKPVGVIGITRDITERKQAEEALRESEERYRQIARCVPDLIWTMDLSGRFTYANSVVERTHGWTVEEFLKLTYQKPAMIEEELMKATSPQYDRNTIRTFESKELRKDGSTFVGEVSAALLWSDDGKPVGVIGITRDITERKQAELERIRLATAIEQAAEAIFITDPDRIIQYGNPAFERLSGYDNTEIIGLHTRVFRSYQHDEAFYRNMRDTLERGEVWSGRIINKKKDGTFYDAESTISPVKDESGAVINYVGIHRDITREVRLEAELHQAQKMEAIGLLASGIAHDFNNILAAVMGFTELSLFKVQEDSPVRRNLEQVLKAATRASELVKQILTFTRQGAHERKPVRIAPIAQEALKLLRSSLPTTIEIRREFAVIPGKDVVLADPGQIHQVLMNLGTNAGHAMRANGGALTVKLSVITDDSQLSLHPDLKAGPHLCMTVSDTGHGMDSAVLERIFDPYFTTKGPGEGTGLGLSVVQGIVKSHGGAITVKSESGRGATFFVFLPILEDVDKADAKESDDIPSGSERILLVDDEEALANLGKEILETLGYQVTAKTSSLDALELFRAQPDAFDLVITDMTMPSLTGNKLAEAISAIRPDTPIILSTGFFDLVNEKRARKAGIREFVMKPYEIRTLAGAVRKALEQR